MITTFPGITLSYLAVLGLIYAALAIAVVYLRTQRQTPYGDGGDATLMHAIRAHGNFAEWVPLITMIVAGLEMSGASETYIHGLMGTLVAARLLHAIGLYAAVGTVVYFVGRVSGALTTWLILLTGCALLLSVSFDRQPADPPQDANQQEIEMSDPSTSAIADLYYNAFTGETSADDIPMHEDLAFSSPRFKLDSAAAFRQALSGLFSRVKGLEITEQAHNGNSVLTFYQLDLGAPIGPIQMAERLSISEGTIADVALLFDSAAMPEPPTN